MNNEQVKGTSRARVIEYFINRYLFNDGDGEIHSSIDRILDVLDVWFSKNDKKWHIDKVYEEYEEIKDAYKSWKVNDNEFTRFHTVVEIADFVAALSSYVKTYVGAIDKLSLQKDNEDFIEMFDTVKSVIKSVGIQVDEIITNIENKLTEIFIGVTTYEKLKSGNSNDVLCRVIRTLYTDKEINDVNNEKKIVKEIRRMWYAREFTKLFD